MRRLEYIDGGSQKFWEAGRDGSDVVVNWGRLGTAGQSKRKEFASVEAAEEFLTKQVGDKLKKGYVESGAAPSTPPAKAATATAKAAPAETAAKEPAAPPDEDTFNPPPGMVRLAFARRDQVRSRFKPNADAAKDMAVLLAKYERQLDNTFAGENSDAALAEPVRRFRDGTRDALGAAALYTTLALVSGFSDRDRVEKFGQALLVDHDLMFAVETVMAMGRLSLVRKNGRYQATSVRLAEDDEEMPWRWGPSIGLGDVRAAVASASDEEYAAILARLTELRELNGKSRLLASFLAPTETAWVDELPDPTRHTDSWMYLSVVHNAEQLTKYDTAGYELRFQSRILPTIVRTVGPDAAPTLARWTEHAETEVLRRLLAAIVVMPTDRAFTALLARIDRPHFRPAVQEAMQRYPMRATRLLAEAAAGGNTVATELLGTHLLAHPELLADLVPTLPAAAREAAEATQDGLVRLPEAPKEALPPVLADPPWTRAARSKAKPVVLADLEVDAPTRLAWLHGEEEKAHALHTQNFIRRHKQADIDWEAEVANTSPHHWWYPSLVLHAPVELVEPLVANWRPNAYNAEMWGPPLLARFGVTAVPAVLNAVSSSTSRDDLKALMPVLDLNTAEVVSFALARKLARPLAKAWLERHGLAALPYLLPNALDRAGKPRRAAEAAVRVLAADHGAEAVVAEATRVAGEEAGAGIAQILDTDPLEVLPKKLPVPGAWAVPAALPQVRLRDKEMALSQAATTDLLTMFALGTTDEPYGGVALVAQECDPASLAAFGWAVFEQWRKASMPPKDGWALTILGAIGDDETVRALAPIIRNWPGEGGHARAVTGLDVLAEIGTDVALMHLNGIAQKVKFSGLKERAKEKIELVAAKLGLTAEQLADRLVPDLGLDDNGTLTLDYGPRKFIVGFDEALRPFVSDEDGTRRKALPKPGAKDDEELAPAAYQRFSALKKDVRTLAGDQILRLERAMVSARRWSAEDFATYFAAHPLLWHVVRRLVWGVYDGDDKLVGAFRLAEDRTLADADDETYTIPDGATVGVAHPLHLADTLSTWAEVFADYEILQPFQQLGRQVLALTDEEKAAPQLARFANIKVNVGKVLGMTKRGWERTTPQDGGVEPGVVKPLPGGVFAVLDLSEGIVAGEPTMLGEEQLITRVFLSADHDGWWAQENMPFSTLDPVSASEVLIDLTELVTAK